METFYCRKLSESGFRVLTSDYRIICTDHGGAITPQYLPYLIVGICLTLARNRGRPSSVQLCRPSVVRWR